MELKIKEVQLPEKIEFNFEELKAELTTKTHDYKVMAYTEDQVKEAKTDRAKLNKLKKALNDERIRLEKEYMKPFNEFKGQVNEIIGIIDEPIAIIDSQVKEFEQRKKDEKRDSIIELWNSKEKPEFLDEFDLFDERWLNSSVSMKKVEEDIDGIIKKTMDEVKIIEELPEYSFESLEEYKRTLDLSKAISEGKRLADIQKRKEEAERQKVELEKAMKEEEERIQNEPSKETESVPIAEEPTPTQTQTEENETPRTWIGFKAYLSKEEAIKLGQFLTENNITIKKIEL
jgi:hypothetical protein